MQRSLLGYVSASVAASCVALVLGASPTSAFAAAHSFSINLRTGVSEPIPAALAPFVSYVVPTADTNSDGYLETVLKLNLNDPGTANPYVGALFTVHYDALPGAGWSVDIGDSASNDGGSGDGGTQSNDCETQIVYTPGIDPGPVLQLLGRDGAPGVVLRSHNSFAQAGDTISLYIANQHVSYDNGRGTASALDSPYLYALNGQPDFEGPVNYDIYAAFNRVVSGGRRGSGAADVTVSMILAPEPATAIMTVLLTPLMIRARRT